MTRQLAGRQQVGNEGAPGRATDRADREWRAGEFIDLEDDGETGQGAADRGQGGPGPQPPERGGLAQRPDVCEQPIPPISPGHVPTSSLCRLAGDACPAGTPPGRPGAAPWRPAARSASHRPLIVTALI